MLRVCPSDCATSHYRLSKAHLFTVSSVTDKEAADLPSFTLLGDLLMRNIPMLVAALIGSTILAVPVAAQRPTIRAAKVQGGGGDAAGFFDLAAQWWDRRDQRLPDRIDQRQREPVE